MIANPEKFHALLVRKDRNDTSGQNINSQGHEIKSEDLVDILGVTLVDKLSFDTQTLNHCKKAATQLNVRKRLRSFIGFEQESYSKKLCCL